MKATLLLRDRLILSEAALVDLRVWAVPAPVRGSGHAFMYALAYVVGGICVLHYDNEAGKGDHRHLGTDEAPYRFVSPEQLLADFWRDVDAWNAR
jgi:hypothetical protein